MMGRRCLLALALVVCATLALGSVASVDDGDHALFAEDIASFIEMAAEAEMEVTVDTAAEKFIYPILDNTGTDSEIPRVNLTQFKVKPIIDTTLVPDAALLPKKPVAVKPVAVASQNATGPTTLPKVGSIQLLNGVKSLVNFLDGNWLNWLKRWGKKYSAIETARRAAIWVANKAKAAAMSLLNAGRYGVNGPFADLDPTEFRQKYLRTRPTVARRARSFIEQAPSFPSDRRSGEVFFETAADMATAAEAEAEAVTDVIDWRSKCTPIKTQHDCGSCWAITAVSVIESALAKAGKPLASLSAQQLVDCNRDGNDGCMSGSFANAFAYLQSHGSTSEASYPYANRQDRCKRASGTGPKVKSSGFAITHCGDKGLGACGTQEESSLPARLRMYGPLAAVIDSALMQFYEGGIINPNSGCGSSWDSMNHAVVIVGYHPTQRYWIMRNSWGSAWGEQGYFRLSYGQNTCGLANFVMYAVV